MIARRKKPDDTKNDRPVSKRTSNPNKIITHRNSRGVIYVGLDVHKKFLQVAAVDEDGTLLLNERTDTDHASVRRFFSQFPRDRTRCVMESSSVWCVVTVLDNRPSLRF